MWTGALCSNIGTWMESVAVGIFVTEATGQAEWAGLAGAAAILPICIVGPFGGALADRYARHRLLMATTVMQMVFAATLTVLAAADALTPPLVVLIVFAAGCANAVSMPTFQSIAPELVPREDLTGAIALHAMQWNIGRVLGPVLAGTAIVLGGYQAAFAVNTLSFVAVVIVVAPLALPKPAAHTRERMLTSLHRGFRYIRAEPGTRAVLLYVAVASLLSAPYQALIPAFALQVFHDERTGTAVLASALGVGAVAVAVALGGLGSRFGYGQILVLASLGLPMALLLIAVAPNLPVAVAATVLFGFCYGANFSMCFTICQLRAPGTVRGRVVAACFLVYGALFPLGSVALGAIGDAIGLRVALAGSAALAVTLLVAIRFLLPGIRTVLHGEHVVANDALDGTPALDPGVLG